MLLIVLEEILQDHGDVLAEVLRMAVTLLPPTPPTFIEACNIN